MPGVALAALHRLSLARVRGGPAWRGGCRRAGRCVLALGLALAFASAPAVADPTGWEREIRETREIAAELYGIEAKDAGAEALDALDAIAASEAKRARQKIA